MTTAVSAVLLMGLGTFAPASATQLERSPGEIREYWTPERMREAAGNDPLIPGGTENRDVRIPLGTDDELGAPWTGGGDIASTAGRLFFNVYHDDGEVEVSSCSANVVESANKSVIMTANHCAQGQDYLFVPGYHDGEMPYGGWTVEEKFTPGTFTPASDFAAFRLDKLDGRPIQDVVGAQAVSFDGSRPDRMDVFGYPRERVNQPDNPYGGKELNHAASDTRDGMWGLIGVGTDMGRGVSGGPFLADFDPATGKGTQVAVVSGTPCLEMDEDGNCTEMELSAYGARFNEVARALYEQAAGIAA
ncbi:trypsin-like serine peptidase [Mycetocola saprophilus]|uniref:trypsin-like serine peptidase n=1 Tax=Mycetocola saprophilus TaxID=76636 RepID=UPI003BEFC4EE